MLTTYTCSLAFKGWDDANGCKSLGRLSGIINFEYMHVYLSQDIWLQNILSNERLEYGLNGFCMIYLHEIILLCEKVICVIT